jgi:RNA-binding protein NOB1
VVQFAKKTGDYAVLSHPDLCILALTYALSLQDKEETEKNAYDQVSDFSLRNAFEYELR